MKSLVKIKKIDNSEESIEMDVFGELGIDKRGLYFVTHIPTGKLVGSFYKKQYAKALCVDPVVDSAIATGNLKMFRDRTQHYIQEDFDEYVGRKEKKEL